MTSGIEAPPELPGSMSPESGSETPTPEKIFGKDVLTSDDIRDISKDIHRLLEEDEPGSVYQAARQLAHMKRAGFEMKHDSKQRAYMLEKLTGQRDAMRDLPPRDHARYLTFLKYISAGHDESFTLNDEEYRRLELESAQAVNDRDGETSASLRVMRRYLVGSENDEVPAVGEIEDRVLADHLQQQVADGQLVGAAVNMGRMKYLQADTGLDTATRQAIIRGAQQVARDRARQGTWRNYASLRNLLTYVSSSVLSVSRAEARGIANNIVALKEEVVWDQGAEDHEGRQWDVVAAQYADARRFQRTHPYPYSTTDAQPGSDEEAVVTNAARETLTDNGRSTIIDEAGEQVILLEESDYWNDDEDDEAVPVSSDVGEYDDLDLPEDLSMFDEEILGDQEDDTKNDADKTTDDSVEEIDLFDDDDDEPAPLKSPDTAVIQEPVTADSNSEEPRYPPEFKLHLDQQWLDMRERASRRVGRLTMDERIAKGASIFQEELNFYIEDNDEKVRKHIRVWDSFAEKVGIDPDINQLDWLKWVSRQGGEMKSMWRYWEIKQAYMQQEARQEQGQPESEPVTEEPPAVVEAPAPVDVEQPEIKKSPLRQLLELFGWTEDDDTEESLQTLDNTPLEKEEAEKWAGSASSSLRVLKNNPTRINRPKKPMPSVPKVYPDRQDSITAEDVAAAVARTKAAKKAKQPKTKDK